MRIKEIITEDITTLPTSWDNDSKHQGKKVSMSHTDAHKLMTTDEYLRDRSKLGPHQFDPNVGGEEGIVGIRLTNSQIDEDTSSLDYFKNQPVPFPNHFVDTERQIIEVPVDRLVPTQHLISKEGVYK